MAWAGDHGEYKVLVDALLYHYEKAALTIRLNTVRPDKCVVVEGDHTFQGERCKPTFDRVAWQKAYPEVEFTHVVLPITPHKDPWYNEYYLRNILGNIAADQCDGPNDYVFLSDADEFATSTDIMRLASPDGPVWLPTAHHYYWTVDWEFVGGKYECAPFVVPGYKLRERNAQRFRFGEDTVDSVHLGWEFSFLGGIEFAQEKYNSFAHRELNKEEVTNADRIADAIKKGLDPSPERGLYLKPRSSLAATLPRWLRSNQEWIHKHKLSRLDW